jgi:hypothetical protein
VKGWQTLRVRRIGEVKTRGRLQRVWASPSYSLVHISMQG